MNEMERLVEEWLARPYGRWVTYHRDDDHQDGEIPFGYFVARVPQLGEATCTGYGNTESEALDMLRESMRDYFTDLEAQGEEPPPALPLFEDTVDDYRARRKKSRKLQKKMFGRVIA